MINFNSRNRFTELRKESLFNVDGLDPATCSVHHASARSWHIWISLLVLFFSYIFGAIISSSQREFTYITSLRLQPRSKPSLQPWYNKFLTIGHFFPTLPPGYLGGSPSPFSKTKFWADIDNTSEETFGVPLIVDYLTAYSLNFASNGHKLAVVTFATPAEATDNELSLSCAS